MKYTLRQLEVFLSVAKNESITLAAQELAMAQSATSAAIQEVENRYAMQLFDRTAKRLKLNSKGKEVRAKAEQLVAHAIQFDETLLQHEEHGELNVGASLTIGNYLAFKYLAKFLEVHPKTKVNIDVGNTPEIVQRVLNFEADVGLIEAEIHNDELVSEVWLADKMTAFCRADHPFANKQQLTDNDILNCNWILREPGSAHRQTFDRSMTGLLPKLKITAQLTHNEAVKNAVKSGLGVGCLSEITIQDEIEHGSLVPLPLKGRPMNRHFYIIQHHRAPQKKAVEWWLDTCQAQR